MRFIRWTARSADPCESTTTAELFDMDLAFIGVMRTVTANFSAKLRKFRNGQNKRGTEN